MNSPRFRLGRLTILLLVCLAVPAHTGAQQSRRFAKDGLAFDYPADWPLRDESDQDTQHLILDRGRDEAEIVILALRASLTPQQLEEAKKMLTPMLVWGISERLRQLGGDLQQSRVSADIGGASAEGIRLRTVLGGEAGSADIYWTALNGHLVYVVFTGSDQARVRAAGAWSLIAGSLRVYSPPQETPAPPTPSRAATPRG